MTEINDTEIEKWGELKLTMEKEGDGYFFYGYGLPSEFKGNDDNPEVEMLFDEADSAINAFKEYVEKKIVDNGGDLEDWEA